MISNFRVSENEYRVYELGGHEYSVFACRYKLKKGNNILATTKG